MMYTPTRVLRRIYPLLLCCLFFLGTGWTALAAEQVDTKPYETYLNTLRSLKANFLQLDSNGDAFQGRFYLFRPGYMRIEYALTRDGKETLPLLMVADGSRFIHYDKQLKETQMASFDATPAGFFLKDHITFSGDVTVKRAWTKDQLTQIELAKKDSPLEGTLTLVFSETPRALRKWIVTDGQGSQTTVTLSQAEENVTPEPNLFNPNKADPDRLIVDGPLDLNNIPHLEKQ